MAYSVIVLAGARPGSCDVCDGMGASRKALIPLGGVRMIDHVMRALRDAPTLAGAKIWLSGLGTDVFRDGAPGDLAHMAARIQQAPQVASGPADALVATLDAAALTDRVLVTTADHPLLSPDIIESFLGGAYQDQCDFAVGLATRRTVESRYPWVQRTYLTFAGEGYSGCNLFLVRTQKGRRAAEFWQKIGHHRKQPLKLMGCIGYRTLAGMLTGRLGLDQAFEQGSARVGAHISPILLPFAEAAIDVDKMSDLDLVRSIMDACLHEREPQYG